MQAHTLRKKYAEFFASRGHTEIASASLLPENDPTVLFTTAGMHPLVPYLTGEEHPGGNRLVSCQKCLRTGDIDEVGDASHLTFFEMLGNWSLGDYFKEDSIRWSWEFLTSKEWLGLDPDRLSVTCFAGDEDAPKDEEAAAIWESLGMPRERIHFLGKEDNWWGPAGQTGPCGPDTEIFWRTTEEEPPPGCTPGSDSGCFVEIWNNVFMQYTKAADGTFRPLARKCVDTGMGLARTAAVLQGLPSVYETELYAPTMAKIAELAGDRLEERHQRVLADHLTASCMIISDGVVPSNLAAGYVLRRLIRKSVRVMRKFELEDTSITVVAETVIENYKDAYPVLEEQREHIMGVLREEEEVFGKALAKGLREFDRIAEGIEKGLQHGGSNNFPMKKAFALYDTHGLPPEVTKELAEERGYLWDQAGYDAAEKKHQEVSRADKGVFRGGLADHSEATTNLHTATHLLHQALRDVLGDHAAQKGSNITPERLRFDFSHDEKVTPEQIAEVERIVNEKIRADLPISNCEMPFEEAKNSGAIGLFGDRYGETVRVYDIGDYSKEICGGPHAPSTKVLGRFKIVKEQAASKGVRRIRAVLESAS